ncbi:carboxymuconolactone decarboxylase family protein [Sulfolobus acidocaldarius]|uniref:Carboxymuconolactone decarboxylase n=4 Tax=Sulfolobus acidocaldarius TaxID=2285 RepID=Q4J7V9_SULAC|nr:carboxymuconolactone decarboxylase family protein [Sulfolobus acidocaldarius]AAY81120.1 carboxymuconolactone decarboxylase [Sulfolobus acidocaldarius DSM 639]AGE71728.1 carboxymuconolactone decarboxylase [Sulfolobus acidocaldarius N8]AGE74001.1 carboxymuconolactone decarboxylase [Sulfolobus acidocaldarius Ron12/I]ALU30067.1 4-carboxymuconolactone decarboxylase [Sulfolobus acidocaldarius]ALU30757.1 4-carboxymuconolactone decarboxylase [Sulfolobus acidocaldarius]
MSSESKYQKGLELRKQVVGEKYVNRALSTATDFSKPLQDLITEHVWGNIWSRPVLDRKTRSLITVAMLIALNRPNELRIHIKGALRNGCSKEEIRELLIHSTVYCGFPAAVDAFKIAEEVIEEWEKGNRD